MTILLFKINCSPLKIWFHTFLIFQKTSIKRTQSGLSGAHSLAWVEPLAEWDQFIDTLTVVILSLLTAAYGHITSATRSFVTSNVTGKTTEYPGMMMMVTIICFAVHYTQIRHKVLHPASHARLLNYYLITVLNVQWAPLKGWCSFETEDEW